MCSRDVYRERTGYSRRRLTIVFRRETNRRFDNARRAYELSNMSRASIQPPRYAESWKARWKRRQKKSTKSRRLIQARLADRIKPIRLSLLKARIRFLYGLPAPIHPLYRKLPLFRYITLCTRTLRGKRAIKAIMNNFKPLSGCWSTRVGITIIVPLFINPTRYSFNGYRKNI